MNEDYKIQGNWGQVAQLKAGFDVFDKDGKLIESREWDSKSYTRWFSRIVKSMFEFTNPSLTDINGNAFTAIVANDTSFQNVNMIKKYNRLDSSTFGFDYTGAMMAIGNGALTGEDSSFYTLKAIIDGPVNARVSTSTITEDNSTLDFQIAQGITIVNSSGETVTEIGLFARLRVRGTGAGDIRQVMLAYDEVNPGIFVPNGGVIAPKYTLSFPA